MTIQEIQAEINQVFPIADKDRFKTAISKIIKSGVEVKVSCAGTGCYYTPKSKGGKQFKLKMVCDGRVAWFGRVKRFMNGNVSQSTIERFPAVYDTSEEALKDSFEMTHVDHCGEGEQLDCIVDDVHLISWGYLAHALSKMINTNDIEKTVCYKCSGTGNIPQFAHRHGGVCYKCCGVGGELVINQK